MRYLYAKNYIKALKKINTKIIWPVLLIISLLLVTLPRFNRYDLGPIKKLSGSSSSYKDSDQYVVYVKYFRKEITINELKLPFAYRPLVPFIASLLPFSPMTSLNAINLASLLIALFMLYRLLISCGIPFKYSLGGCFAFIFSFPTFYYGTVGYTDPVLILFLILGTYFIVNEKTTQLVITILIGSLVKETIVIIIPVFFLFYYLRRKPWKISTVISLGSYLGIMWILRAIFIEKGKILWLPSLNILISNISRPKAWISSILTFGIPGFLFIILSIKYGWKKFLLDKALFYSLATGFFMSLTLAFYAAASAYLDGRYLWTSYPFTIPLSLLLLRSRKYDNLVKATGVV
jgi:hypothetical protein